MAIRVRNISTFSRGILNILLSKPGDFKTMKFDAEAAHRILHTRLIPEMEAVNGPDAAETRGYLIRVILQLLCIDDLKEITDWATTSIISWYHEGPEWKSSFEQRLQQLVRSICPSCEAKLEPDVFWITDC